jgi:hypothetical protein
MIQESLQTKARQALHASGSAEWGTPMEVIASARALMGGIDLDPASSSVFQKNVQAKRFFSIEDDALQRSWESKTVFLNPPGGHPEEVVGGAVCLDAGKLPNGDLFMLVEAPNFKRRKIASKRLGERNQIWSKGDVGTLVFESSESLTKLFWSKLLAEYDAGRVEQAVFLAFSLEALANCQDEGIGRFPMCVPRKRLQFLNEDGTAKKQPTHANAVVYLPPQFENRIDVKIRFLASFGDLGAVYAPVEGNP